jgi:hypothetical protein
VDFRHSTGPLVSSIEIFPPFPAGIGQVSERVGAREQIAFMELINTDISGEKLPNIVRLPPEVGTLFIPRMEGAEKNISKKPQKTKKKKNT